MENRDTPTHAEGTDDEAARLIDDLQAFVFGEIELSGADVESAMQRLDELLPDAE